MMRTAAVFATLILSVSAMPALQSPVRNIQFVDVTKSSGLIFTHNSGANSKGPNPYIAKLQLSGLNMATAQNFAGGTVTYIQGKITNAGDRKVTGATAEVVFKNSLGEVSQREDSLPIMVLLPNLPYVDYGPLEHAPLASGQTRDFRLSLEHVTADWDGQVPQIKVVSVSANQ